MSASRRRSVDRHRADKSPPARRQIERPTLNRVPEAASQHEIGFGSARLRDVVRIFLETGSVLLRGFCEPDRILELKEVLDGIYEEAGEFHVNDSDLRDRGLPQMHDYILTAKHRALIDKVFEGFGAPVWRNSARRMAPPGAPGGVERTWQLPLAPHLEFVLPYVFFHGQLLDPPRPLRGGRAEPRCRARALQRCA